MLEKTLESPLDCKEIRLINLKENQPWIFISRTDTKVEAPILWPPEAKSQLVGKDSDPEKNWRQKEKQGQSMRCLDSITYSMDKNLSKLWEIVKDREVWGAAVHWSHKEMDTSEQLNNSNNNKQERRKIISLTKGSYRLWNLFTFSYFW